MIGTSRFEYFYIQFFIFILYYFAPSCLIYCAWSFARYGFYKILTSPLSLYCLAEGLFFLGFFPYRKYLQRDAVHSPAPSRQQRRKLVSLCHGNIPSFEAYMRGWFLGADLKQIKRDNLKDFMLWAFFNRGGHPGQDDAELEEYIEELESSFGRTIEKGRGDAVPLRLTLDKVEMLHRSLLWSPAEYTAYWFRPHTSKTHLPVVFFHGIGIGLYPNTKFLHEINSSLMSDPLDPNNQIGILVIENMPISFRLTHKTPSNKEICSQIDQIILNHFSADQKFVFVAHSFGTNIVSLYLKSSSAKCVKSIVLIDPIPILLHLPTVAYNFTRRPPVHANELQLFYFASMDSGVAHTLGRHFFWNEVVLWKEDLGNRNLTVSLSSRDLIVDTEAVGRYLSSGDDDQFAAHKKHGSKRFTDNTSSPSHQSPFLQYGTDGLNTQSSFYGDGEEWKSRPWRGHGIDILWFQDLDHGQVFDKFATRHRLVEAVHTYCLEGCLESIA